MLPELDPEELKKIQFSAEVVADGAEEIFEDMQKLYPHFFIETDSRITMATVFYTYMMEQPVISDKVSRIISTIYKIAFSCGYNYRRSIEISEKVLTIGHIRSNKN